VRVSEGEVVAMSKANPAAGFHPEPKWMESRG